MRTKLRGLRHIPSVMKLERLRRSRAYDQDDEYEVFNELAQLGREKARLNKERGNWEEKIRSINARLKHIEEAQESLRQRIHIDGTAHPPAQNPKQANGQETREVIIKY